MLRRFRTSWLLALLCVLVLGGMTDRAQAAGWRINMRTAQGAMTLLVDEQYGAKIVTQPGMSMISRVDQQRLYRVDEAEGVHASMAWSEINHYRNTAKSLLGGLSSEQRTGLQQRMTQMMQNVQNMTPEQKAYAQQMLERYMGQQQGAASVPREKTYEIAAAQQTINGFETRRVIERIAGQKSREFWVATVQDWQRIGAAWKNALEPLREDQDDFAVEKLGGLPIRIVDASGVTEVLSMQPQQFTADDFAPSANSREVGMMQMQ